MLRASFPIGRIFNVAVRVHVTFPLLLALAAGYSLALTGSAARGVGLWCALCFAVLVRECARALAAAYAGLRPRALFLLPVGGLMAFSTHDGAPPPAATRLFPWIGPVANIFAGVLIGAASYALVPQINLIAQPWIAITHILRSVVWMQIILGGVSLLPLPNLPGGSAAASDEPVTGPAKGRATFKLQLPQLGLGTALAIVMILSGLILMNLFLIILGGFMLLGAQIATAHQANSTAGAETILVREVMLTEYTLLSSSDTLQGALDRTVHSLQDVFPVVRGNQLVGSIARQTIAARLFTEGDSYLQGIMSRSLQLTAPTDKLVEALRRASTFGASEFIPVVDDGCLIGILTPQSLSRAVQQVKLLHARTKATERERERD
jgi:predicted transcriptional regulator